MTRRLLAGVSLLAFALVALACAGGGTTFGTKAPIALATPPSLFRVSSTQTISAAHEHMGGSDDKARTIR